MDSVIKISYHKRLFLMLLSFLWIMVLCCIVFQYMREKHYKSEILSTKLQIYNQYLLETQSFKDVKTQSFEVSATQQLSISASQKLPFEDLRITIMTLSGEVIYDNMLSIDSLDNHSKRPEVIAALKKGAGYHIGRYSASDGRQYFYSATRGDDVVVRTAIPYSASLHELLAADWEFLGVIVMISLIMSVLAYVATQRLGRSIERLNRFSEEQEKIRIKQQLTNNINHELKTPVASIQVCLETLLSGINLTDEKRQELIERCYTNNERLRRLLEDVSLITRMESGSQLIGKETVNINSIIDEISDELNILPEDERLYLHANFDDQVVINGNLSLIASVFRNLTENAIAYSGGKNIFITLMENTDQQCVIRFEDDGRGVEEEQLPRLFERFYRVDKGRSRRMGGTGLGLAIVKHAVQFHGGNITVVNRTEGGLKFEFSLKK